MGKPAAEGSGAASSHVYVLHREYAWIPALLLEQNIKDDTARVSIPQYPDESKILNDGGKHATSYKEEVIKLKLYPGKVIPLANVDKAGNLIEREDMVDLPYLHEVREKDGERRKKNAVAYCVDFLTYVSLFF
jgi:hypothetical protein